ncbi:MAG: DUF1905 domain-containing protein, partial [Nocardioides sp.]
ERLTRNEKVIGSIPIGGSHLALVWWSRTRGTRRPSPGTRRRWRHTHGMAFMDFEFEGPVVEWRGPAPFYFVRIPEEESEDIKSAAKGLEYWGQVPVVVRINDIEFRTALFPKNGLYLLPLKVVVRTSARIELDQLLAVALNVGRE